ncbi:MAG: hypothetical protein FWB97_09945 [Oscillospiraceae bacterium]|nr:hypothetical protein [Oscillospiraceae bacterium]
MRKIAIIENGFVRDTQVFAADLATLGTDPNWEDYFIDLKNPCHFIGIVEGWNQDDILNRAAELEGVHTDVITLLDY